MHGITSSESSLLYKCCIESTPEEGTLLQSLMGQYICMNAFHGGQSVCHALSHDYIFIQSLHIICDYTRIYKHIISPYCCCQEWKPTTSETSPPQDGGHAASPDGPGSSLGGNHEENSHQDSLILGQQLEFPDDDFSKELEAIVDSLELPLPGPPIPQILSPSSPSERKDSPDADSQAPTVAGGGEDLPLKDQHSDGGKNGSPQHQLTSGSAPPNAPALKPSQGCQDGRVPKEFLYMTLWHFTCLSI